MTLPYQKALWLARVMAFLNEIGIHAEYREGATGFIAHVLIEKGRLLVSPEASPSNLLHEAGHLSNLPGNIRHLVDHDVESISDHVIELARGEDPDSPLMRACLQCSDPEATAWAWAAGRYLGIPDNLIIEDDDYDGEGAAIRSMLAARAYIGINGLRHGGMTTSVRGPGGYPVLTRWVQPVFDKDALPQREQA